MNILKVACLKNFNEGKSFIYMVLNEWKGGALTKCDIQGSSRYLNVFLPREETIYFSEKANVNNLFTHIANTSFFLKRSFYQRAQFKKGFRQKELSRRVDHTLKVCLIRLS